MIRFTKEEKDAVQVISAMAMLAVGVAFGAAGFWVPPRGQVHDSVLWIMAQCFIYAGSAMGIMYYANRAKREIREDLGLKAERDENTDR